MRHSRNKNVNNNDNNVVPAPFDGYTYHKRLGDLQNSFPPPPTKRVRFEEEDRNG